MRFGAGVIAGLSVLAFAAPAQAFQGDRHVGRVANTYRPYLTMDRAERAFIADARLDHPGSIALDGCYRVDRTGVVCRVLETDVYVFGGQAIRAMFLREARLIRGHIHIDWCYDDC